MKNYKPSALRALGLYSRWQDVALQRLFVQQLTENLKQC